MSLGRYYCCRVEDSREKDNGTAEDIIQNKEKIKRVRCYLAEVAIWYNGVRLKED